MTAITTSVLYCTTDPDDDGDDDHVDHDDHDVDVLTLAHLLEIYRSPWPQNRLKTSRTSSNGWCGGA